MKVGSLFAGIGGFDLAAEQAGHDVVWQSENDKYASQTLAKNFPDVPNLGDIHDISSAPEVDALVGGFPCQDYSVAGRGEGLSGDRGALWWEFHRLVAAQRPQWVLGENVPGILYGRRIHDFETIVGSLTELGYGVAWGILDAQYFGVAQRRRRVFIVGNLGGQPRPGVLALSEGMFGYPAPSREEGEGVAPTIAARTRGGGWPGTDEAIDGAVLAFYPDTVTALRARDHKGPAMDVSEPSVVAYVARTAQTGSNGLGISGHDIDGEETTHTLDAAGPEAVIAFAQNQRAEVRDLNDVAGSLAANPGMKQQTYVAEVSHTLRENFRNNSDPVTEAKQHVYDLDEPQIRRLTPLECERLQGFPDGWTEGVSNTQRYRQLGNAVCVPVASWILERMNA